LDRLRERYLEHLLYESSKQDPGGTGPQIVTPLQLLDRLVARVPAPRVHRHRCYGAPMRLTGNFGSGIDRLKSADSVTRPSGCHDPFKNSNQGEIGRSTRPVV
jgi:hypothetical protein